MKKKLLEMLAKKEARKQVLGTNAAATESVEELRSINAELETLNAEIAQLRSMADALPDENEEGLGAPSARSQQPGAGQPQPQAFNVLGTYGANGGAEGRGVNTNDFEQRQAFMTYVQTGKRPETLETRADATTGVSDVSAVIPKTILDQIVEKLKDHGRIWARVTKTSIQGGVEVPVSSAKPVATWTAAGSMSDKQKKQVTGKVSFSYHKLQARVAVELVAETVSMAVFEQTIVNNIYEAMIVALEAAIINGTGSGQPLGIAKDTNIPNTRVVSLAPSDFGKYTTWPTLYGKVPRSYRNGAVLIMNDLDWNKYIVGMVDENGQPVARVNYGFNGTTEERLLGKEVIAIEDHLPSVDDAAVGDVVGILVKLEEYLFNSNMQLTFKRYFNEDTDETISKATLIGDGKLADTNGVVLIKKKAEPTPG